MTDLEKLADVEAVEAGTKALPARGIPRQVLVMAQVVRALLARVDALETRVAALETAKELAPR